MIPSCSYSFYDTARSHSPCLCFMTNGMGDRRVCFRRNLNEWPQSQCICWLRSCVIRVTTQPHHETLSLGITQPGVRVLESCWANRRADARTKGIPYLQQLVHSFLQRFGDDLYRERHVCLLAGFCPCDLHIPSHMDSGLSGVRVSFRPSVNVTYRTSTSESRLTIHHRA